MALGERGRNPFFPRSTAEGAASLRAAGALERDPSARCPDDLAAGFLGGLNISTLAKHRLTRPLYIRRVNSRLPGAYPYEIGRTRYIDEVVLAEVEAGLDELVVLGAGLDSRPYRLASQLAGVRVLEVDHPATQATKRERVERLLGEIPSEVTFVAVDFTRDDMRERLAAAGHDEDAATLFIWSGVAPYLPEQAVAEVLGWVGEHSSARTSIVFDACWAEAIDGTREYFGSRELVKGVAAVGEPLLWGIPEGRQDETIGEYGLRVEESLDEKAATRRYLTRSDGSIVGRPYGFGVLLHARVAR